MPIQTEPYIIDLTAGGGTKNLSVKSPITLYIIKGTVTLTSNWTIQPSGTAVEGMVYEFKYEADINLNGNTITLFGTAIPETLVDKTHQITAYYDGSGWEVNFLVDVNENGSIPSSLITPQVFQSIDSGAVTLDNGVDSPYTVNSVQAEATSVSTLFARANYNANFLELTGELVLTLDETATVGSINPTVFAFTNITDHGSFQIPVRLARYDVAGGAVNPTSYIDGVLQYTTNFAPVTLLIQSGEIGASTNATYRVTINLKLEYL